MPLVIASLEAACDDKRARNESNDSVTLTPKINLLRWKNHGDASSSLAVGSPYNAIYLAFRLSSFAMRQIGAVIAPLHPRDQRQDLFQVICPQRQNNLYDPPELRHRQRRSFFSPSAASGATESNAPASSSAYG